MPRSYKAGHRGAQPVLRSGRCNPASLVARVESWPIPIAPCNVAACNCISHCATLAPQVSLFARAFVERCTQRPVRLGHRSSNLPRGGRCRILRQRPARPDHFRDRAQRSLAAILALTVVCQTSIEPKFSPQFEFDNPPSVRSRKFWIEARTRCPARALPTKMLQSEDSNSDVSEPVPQCAVMDDVGCGQRSILPRREDYSPGTTGRSASVQIIPNIAEGSKR